MKKPVEVHIRAKPCDENDIWLFEQGKIGYAKSAKMIAFSCFKSIYYKKSTLQIYKEQILPAIRNFINNENVTIMAYGQTGSGKTYTMMGEDTDGLIYLALHDILPRTITMSYMEIYNERVYDLYTLKELGVFCKDQETVVANLHTESVRDEKEAYTFLKFCGLNRRCCATEFNLNSSRSHTIIQVKSETRTLNFIDLAGSEKASVVEDRRKEGAYINKSLLALGKLVTNLLINKYVGFRESKLTRILSQSLNPDTNFIVLCMISTAEKCLEETLSTLQFAARMSSLDLKGIETSLPKAFLARLATEEHRKNAECAKNSKVRGARHGVKERCEGGGSHLSTKKISEEIVPSLQIPGKASLPIEVINSLDNRLKKLSCVKLIKKIEFSDLFTESQASKEQGGSNSNLWDCKGTRDRGVLSAASSSSDAIEDRILEIVQKTDTSEEIFNMTVEIYEKRVVALERMVLELLDKSPNRLFSEIFILERQMFILKKDMVLAKKNADR